MPKPSPLQSAAPVSPQGSPLQAVNLSTIRMHNRVHMLDMLTAYGRVLSATDEVGHRCLLKDVR